jgi:hypothetical protein
LIVYTTLSLPHKNRFPADFLQSLQFLSESRIPISKACQYLTVATKSTQKASKDLQNQIILSLLHETKRTLSLFTNATILALFGGRVDGQFRITAKTTRALRIRWEELLKLLHFFSNFPLPFCCSALCSYILHKTITTFFLCLSIHRFSKIGNCKLNKSCFHKGINLL